MNLGKTGVSVFSLLLLTGILTNAAVSFADTKPAGLYTVKQVGSDYTAPNALGLDLSIVDYVLPDGTEQVSGHSYITGYVGSQGVNLNANIIKVKQVSNTEVALYSGPFMFVNLNTRKSTPAIGEFHIIKDASTPRGALRFVIHDMVNPATVIYSTGSNSLLLSSGSTTMKMPPFVPPTVATPTNATNVNVETNLNDMQTNSNSIQSN